MSTTELPIKAGLNTTLSFSNAVYSLDTLKKAAYRLSKRCSIQFYPLEDTTTCELLFQERLTEPEVLCLVNDYQNEVLDQDLRAIVAEETSAVRNAVLAYAFSNTGLQSNE